MKSILSWIPSLEKNRELIAAARSLIESRTGGGSSSRVAIARFPEDEKKWMVSSDATIGGRSAAVLLNHAGGVLSHVSPVIDGSRRRVDPVLLRDEVFRALAGEGEKEEEKRGVDTQRKDAISLPAVGDVGKMVRWCGKVSKSSETSKGSAGYVVMRMRYKQPINLSAYDYLQVKYRNDGKRYLLTMQMQSAFTEEIYQMPLPLPPRRDEGKDDAQMSLNAEKSGEWMVVGLPIEEMTRVWLGRPVGRDPNISENKSAVISIGVVLKDETLGENSPFYFDLQYILGVTRSAWENEEAIES